MDDFALVSNDFQKMWTTILLVLMLFQDIIDFNKKEHDLLMTNDVIEDAWAR